MENLGVESKIYYFKEEGKINTDMTIEFVLKRKKLLNIKKILVFTTDGETAFKIREKDMDIKIIAVSFPYKQEFAVTLNNNESNKITIPATSKPEIQNKLLESDILLLQGSMPFSEILIPGVKETKKQTIYYTLSLIAGGLNICIQSIIMATDGGLVEPGEEVIAMSADTAIVGTGANSYYMFHPSKGLEVKEIICKPRNLSIIHKKPREKK